VDFGVRAFVLTRPLRVISSPQAAISRTRRADNRFCVASRHAIGLRPPAHDRVSENSAALCLLTVTGNLDYRRDDGIGRDGD